MLNLNASERNLKELLQIDHLKLSPGQDLSVLTAEAAKVLRLREKDLKTFHIQLVYTVAVDVENEAAVLKRCRSRHVRAISPKAPYRFPTATAQGEPAPVVVGAGPAGLFATLVLAEAGLRPILLERGRSVEERQADVERFWQTGALDLSSNVQFGEGGAGAFSDGKLNTGTKDPRHRFILEELVRCGAPEDILIDAKPHVGTDYLHIALKRLRQELLSLGAEIRFSHQLTGIERKGGALSALTVTGPEGAYRLPCTRLILCPGHSARDTFQMLFDAGVPMEAKPCAVGVRIEQRQADCDAAQYKEYAGHPERGVHPPGAVPLRRGGRICRRHPLRRRRRDADGRGPLPRLESERRLKR